MYRRKPGVFLPQETPGTTETRVRQVFRNQELMLMADEATVDSEAVDRGIFEWVTADCAMLAPCLSPEALGLAPDARVLDIGCGTSILPLHLAAMYTNVIGVDRETHCAASMTARFGERAGLRWVTADVTAAAGAMWPLADGCVELVVDKGMLDCALTEDLGAPLLCNVARLLTHGGVYAVISFRRCELLEALLRCTELPWTVERCEPLPTTGSSGDEALAMGHSNLCVMRVTRGSCEGHEHGNDVAVRRHLHEVMNRWYTEQSPLLTPEREMAIREAWSAAAAALTAAAAGKGASSEQVARSLPADHLPLSIVFEVLFTAEERDEIGFDGFMSDLAALEPEDAALNASLLTMSTKGTDLRSISLERALTYLRTEQ